MRNCNKSDIICKDNSEKRYEEESRRRVNDKSASLSNIKGSDYNVTGLSNIKKSFSCDDNLSNKYSYQSYFKTGEIIDNESYYKANEITNNVVSLDSDTSDEEMNTHKFLRDYIDKVFNEHPDPLAKEIIFMSMNIILLVMLYLGLLIRLFPDIIVI
ncbi:14507_t:CDS:2 [Funneliformis mosseae]|uniref:14507_t:CDS:1 n=1 Tax=Funneliformis mosseae TaxID=27381 RepID=A0A9N9BUJ4_FUNMO|nr:14507_t:CDS:2 [Funneliformis mosseae]